MSFLTKKSLFFMVLSIVCSLTFANGNLECEDNLHLVFPDTKYTIFTLENWTSNFETYVAFNYSMFALSLKFIDSMTTTGALSTSLLDQFERFKHSFDEDEVISLSIVGNYVGNKDVEITKSAKTDISGYFKRLIMYFYTIYDEFEKRVKSPAKFCAEDYKNEEEECRKALKHMLKKTDDDKFNKMHAENAFEHCYLNYRYLDFFDDSIFSESGSSSTISQDKQQPQNIRLDDIADCEFNVHLVFPNARYTRLALNNSATSQYTLALYNSAKFPETYLAFNFSMFALSLKVIDSMTTTEALSDDLLRQFDRFKNTFGEDEVRFLSVIGNYVRIENVEITKSKKSDISGYLDGLTNNLYAIYGDFQTRVKSPAKFCEEDYTDDEDECRKALKHMLKKKDDDEFNEMRADQAFRHCYLNYRYLDFFGKSIFSESGSSSSSSSSSSSTTISHYHRQPQNIGLVFSESGSSSTTISHNQQKIQLGIMKHYFELSMTTMNVMAKEKLEEDYPLFPSVEDYCFYKR